jgi:ribosome-associated translation inhibitor RaiA
MTIAPRPFTPQLYRDGQVPPEAVKYAVAKVETALHHAPAPVLHVRLTLRQPTEPTPAHHPRAQVDVDLNGVHIGAHADPANMREAVDLMQDRLRTRMARNARR